MNEHPPARLRERFTEWLASQELLNHSALAERAGLKPKTLLARLRRGSAFRQDEQEAILEALKRDTGDIWGPR